MHDIEALASQAVDCGFRINKEVGPGLLESVYEVLLAAMLERRGLRVQRQKSVPIKLHDIVIPDAFRADRVIEDTLIVEIKSVERNAPIHSKQLLTYLRLTEQPLGLLMNFGCETFRDGLRRVLNGPAARYAGRSG